ncbi:MAG: CIA30 family protein [Aphanocapsa feldmannii 277cV]|uniref:CIA30 family protein n=2 Tax=Aphanocapsa feldmannii TaxID=192050 RepID=A0A524RLZ7_9CHRO|nr:MAG: CIA30 family protein [Aphanocapsa feldmannii 288cV]TGG91200.1 MAG: CIA30 family protein [Aphanocapsa feldmannii 277cV]TGH27308.1 MAG: CIA30 family protein [Aphanocapsa feldmannii 277cI]
MVRPVPLTLFRGDGFSGWRSLNDTIMGGRSQGHCHIGSWGLELTANLVAQGGGFVSVRSPVLDPPLDLSGYDAFRLTLRGDGRRYKFAVACADPISRASELIPGGLRWVKDFTSQAEGTTLVVLPFQDLAPVVRANPVGIPLRFSPDRIRRLQLLHSRFSDDGGKNPGFAAGPLRLTLLGIDAIRATEAAAG